jgi:hypothetical protein
MRHIWWRSYLDGFIVDHRIDGNSGCLVVGSIGLLPKLCSPRCRKNGESGVCCHGGSGDKGKLPAVLVGLTLSVTA